jgi:hypothetical protein
LSARIASVDAGDQGTGKIISDDLVGIISGRTDAYRNIPLGEKLARTAAHTTRHNVRYAFFAEKLRQEARLVRRRDDIVFLRYGLAVIVNIE